MSNGFYSNYNNNSNNVSVDFMLKCIKPDLEGELSKYKKRRNVHIFLFILSFVMFGAGGALTGIVGFYFIFMPILGFIGFPLNAILMGLNITKIMFVSQYLTLIKTIKNEEKILIRRLSGINNEFQTLTAIRKLIETENLTGYYVAYDLMVVRDGITVTKQQVVEEIALFGGMGVMGVNSDVFTGDQPIEDEANEQDSYNYCPSCGEQVSGDSNYCANCGQRLYR